MVRKHKKSLVTRTLKVHGQSFKMFEQISPRKKERRNSQEGFQLWLKSQLGKSSFPKDNHPQYHIFMSLELDWAFGYRQSSFLSKLPFK